MIFIVQNETVISNANPEQYKLDETNENRGHKSRFKIRICELKTFE